MSSHCNCYKFTLGNKVSINCTKDSSVISTQYPELITSYNKYMGGVDLKMNNVASITILGSKEEKKIIDLTIIITNVFILCWHYTNLEVRTIKKVRMTWATSLINDYCSHKYAGCPSTKRIIGHSAFSI